MHKQKKVGDKVLREFEFLKKLAYLRTKEKVVAMVRSATERQLICIAEVALNILHRRFSLRKYQLVRLAPFGNDLVSLARVHTPGGVRRVLLKSNDARMVSSLLLPVISAVGRLKKYGSEVHTSA